MAYRLRIAAEVRLWLHDLRAADPGAARLVGAAVTALAGAGPGLGPPLVTTVACARPVVSGLVQLDRSYQRQLEFLQRVRRGIADVATSKRRIELLAGQQDTSIARLERERAGALEAGRQEVAQQAEGRLAAARSQLAALRENLAEVAATEADLAAAGQHLMAKVDAFRTHKEAVKARFTAAEALYEISRAASELGEVGELSEVSKVSDQPDDTGRPGDQAGRLDAELLAESAVLRAEISSAADLEAELLTASREPDVSREPSAVSVLGAASDPDADSAGAGQDEPDPAELLELRPGAARGSDLRLLFAVDPPGTIVLLDAGWPSRESDEPQELDAWYSESVEVARERLDGGLLTAYGEGMFAAEFFPGQGTQIEADAAVLARQCHRHDLAQLRKQAGLSQAQLAVAMNVPAGQIPAIEGAEPGSRQIAAVAAYVQALGGRLEIVADLGADRMVLR